MDDYRNTKYCITLDGISFRKQKVKEMVLSDHPKAEDMHAYVSVNAGPYKTEFIKAYNYKCAYCGVSIDLIDSTSFEVDHFINQKAEGFQSKKAAGTIENLVLACHDCNHNKSGFTITNSNKEELNPDKEIIKSLFYRDDMFYIKLSDEASGKEDVEYFYEQLHLGNEKHRIDYLVMSMIGLRKELKEKGKEKESHELSTAINILILKRNLKCL